MVINNIPRFTPEQLEAIDWFVENCEQMAEQKMMETGVLEGSHYNAMMQLQKRIKEAHKEKQDSYEDLLQVENER